LDQIAHVGVSSSISFKLIVKLFSKYSNLCDPDPPTLQTDGQTDGRHAIARPLIAL